MKKPTSLTVIIPALNEQESLRGAVATIIAILQSYNVNWEIVIVNDGSIDKTGDIAVALAKEDPRIKPLHHKQPMGIGCCFRDGVKISTKDAVIWFSADGENDIGELLRYLPLLEYVDIVLPFMSNNAIRPVLRRFISRFYLNAINLSFGTSFNYTNGTTLYRKCVFKKVEQQLNSAVFFAECLIKATRYGFTYAEVPILIGEGKPRHSRVVSLKSLSKILWEFAHLFFAIHFGKYCITEDRKYNESNQNNMPQMWRRKDYQN